MAHTLSIGDRAFGIVAAFITGLLVASLGWNLGIMLGALFVGCVILQRFLKFRFWKEGFLFITVIIFGALYYHLYLTWEATTMRLPFDKEISFTAVVADEPKESNKYEIFTVNPWRSHPIMILAPPESGFHYGDFIKIRGLIGKSDMPHDDPFVVSPAITFVASHRGFWLRQILIDGKQAVIGKFTEVLPQDQAALLAGVAFGGLSGMSADLKSEMAVSGTSYILSMYGYKIAAVTAAAAAALQRFFSRRTTFFASIALVILFALMAGLSATVIRAAIAVAIALTAKEIGRPLDKRNAFAFTAVAMLGFDPTLLVGDIGFQLSFLSVLGMAYLDAPIKRAWRYTDSGFLGWKDGATATLAVLIPIIPFIANADGSFSLTTIPSNLLMFIATPFTMLFGYMLAAVSFLFSFAAFFVAKIGSVILAYQLFVIKMFSMIVIPLPISFHIPVVMSLYYAALGIFIYHESD
jgi:competence protein ComEC